MAEDAQALVNLAVDLKKRGDLAGAIDALRRAHMAAPQNAVILEKLGTMLLKQGNLADAEHSYRAALALAPQSINVLHNLALVLEQTGRTDAALENYVAILRFAPDYAGAIKNATRILALSNRFDPSHVALIRGGRTLHAMDAAGYAAAHPALCLARDTASAGVPHFVLQIADADIVWPGLVFQGDTFIDAVNGYSAFESAYHMPQTFPLKITAGGQGIALTLAEPAQREVAAGRIGLFSATGNYASWLLGELPKLAAYADAGIQRFVFHGPPQAYYFDTLAGFGIGRDQVQIVAADACVKAPDFVLATPTYRHHNMSFRALEGLRTRFFAARPDLAAAPPSRSLYISRSGLGPVHDRRIANETEVEAFFAARGFDVVHPQTLPFAEQAAAFAAARRIVAPFGAALANCMFCASGTQVGVIETKQSPEFGRLFQWRGLESFALPVQGQKVREGANLSQTHEFVVPAAALQALLAAMDAKR